MLTVNEAATIIKRNLIDCAINAAIPWEDNWLFSVYTSDIDEGELNALTKRAQGLSFNRLDNKNLNSTGLTAWMKDS